MSNPTTQRVADRVRAELAVRRESGQGLASAIGMSRAAMSRRLCAELPFNLNELDAIAAHFGITTPELVAGTGFSLGAA